MTRCAVVVTTHRRPDALARVLESLAAQSRPPDELIVAEDGADAETAAVALRYATAASFRVLHVRQEHQGFRAGRIRNAAIAATACGYVVLLDGDMVAHPRFLEDHLAAARRGCYVQGTRIPLDERATLALLAPASPLPVAASAGLGGVRRVYALRAPLAARALQRAANSFVAVKSCNQGFWRDDLVAANGFDESMHGWGAEDKELCARLENSGLRRRSLVFAAIAYHLGHPPASRERAAENRSRWLETARTGRRRCDLGLDGHRGS